MHTVYRLLIVIFVMFVGAFFLGVFAANQSHKQELENMEKRALRLEQKDCYSWQEIEIVIFGEIQE